MTDNIPPVIRNIALLTSFMACLLLGFGSLVVLVGLSIIEIGTESGFVVGKLIKLYGVLLLICGIASLATSIGLYKMRDWARIWGIAFFKTFFFLCIMMFIFNIMVPICSITSLVFAILGAYCWKKLSDPYIRSVFERGIYEPPDWTASNKGSYAIDVKRSDITSEAREESHVNVPNGMMLCPNCQTMNLITDDFCSICGTDLKT